MQKPLLLGRFKGTPCYCTKYDTLSLPRRHTEGTLPRSGSNKLNKARDMLHPLEDEQWKMAIHRFNPAYIRSRLCLRLCVCWFCYENDCPNVYMCCVWMNSFIVLRGGITEERGRAQGLHNKSYTRRPTKECQVVSGPFPHFLISSFSTRKQSFKL